MAKVLRLVFTSAAERKRRGMNMALTRDFRETVQARVKRDAAFRKGLLSEAIESLLFGEVTLGKELLRDYINATVGFPKLASHTKKIGRASCRERVESWGLE